MNADEHRVRVVGVGTPLPVEHVAGRIPPGRFAGGAYVSIKGAIAERVDFSGHRFEHLVTEGSTFVDCDFRRVRIESGYLDPRASSTFRDCRFDGFRTGSLIWGTSRFEHCSFRDLRLNEWEVDSTEFVDCAFSGRIDGAIFSATPRWPHDDPAWMIPFRTTTELRGNDFSQVDLRLPDFRGGVLLSANTWPDGPDYHVLDRWQERLRAATATVARWTDDQERESALWWIGLHRSGGREEQTEILLRMSDWSRLKAPSTWRRLWPILSADPT